MKTEVNGGGCPVTSSVSPSELSVQNVIEPPGGTLTRLFQSAVVRPECMKDQTLNDG